MYKKQMTAQKIVCMAAIIVSAIFFLYTLGIMTDLYDSLYKTMPNPNDVFETSVPGSIVYYNMQEFNRMFLMCSIGQILLACLLFITNTHSRRRYYIGNFAAVGLFAVAGAANAVFAHTYIEIFKAQFLQVDFEALKAFSELMKTLYTESTFWFDLHYAVFGLLLLVCALLVANAVWKVALMKDEQKLVAEGRRSAG